MKDQETDKLVKEIIDNHPKDSDGLPQGMRKFAEEAISNLFCEKGEELVTNHGLVFPFCPVCGESGEKVEKETGDGFTYTFAVTEWPHPGMALWIRHPNRSCVAMLSGNNPVVEPGPKKHLLASVTAVVSMRQFDEAKLNGFDLLKGESDSKLGNA